MSINLIGCDVLTSGNLWHGKIPIPINMIAQNNQNESIYIMGKVIKLAPLVGNNAYQIQDETGKLFPRGCRKNQGKLRAICCLFQ